jgi:hypothetical protein
MILQPIPARHHQARCYSCFVGTRLPLGVWRVLRVAGAPGQLQPDAPFQGGVASAQFHQQNGLNRSCLRIVRSASMA